MMVRAMVEAYMKSDQNPSHERTFPIKVHTTKIESMKIRNIFSLLLVRARGRLGGRTYELIMMVLATIRRKSTSSGPKQLLSFEIALVKVAPSSKTVE
jgi:hypothetical protein